MIILAPSVNFYTSSTLREPVQERPNTQLDQAREPVGLGEARCRPEMASHVVTQDISESPTSSEKSGVIQLHQKGAKFHISERDQLTTGN